MKKRTAKRIAYALSAEVLEALFTEHRFKQMLKLTPLDRDDVAGAMAEVVEMLERKSREETVPYVQSEPQLTRTSLENL